LHRKTSLIKSELRTAKQATCKASFAPQNEPDKKQALRGKAS
jgi:hypothetical protein